jgi:acyl-CoA synthetase (AMP-forming)/AMP-acid ligase II
MHEVLYQRGARVNDFMIIFLNDNPAFLRGFWGGIQSGVIPVPLAVGIADEHRFKLLRIAKKLGNPWLYTDRRSFDRLGDFAARVGETATFEKLRERSLLIET